MTILNLTEDVQVIIDELKRNPLEILDCTMEQLQEIFLVTLGAITVHGLIYDLCSMPADADEEIEDGVVFKVWLELR